MNISIETSAGTFAAWVDKDSDEIQSREAIVPESVKEEVPGEVFYVTQLQDLLYKFDSITIKFA